MDQIIKHLFEMQDLKYRDFNAKLIPDTEKDRVIGESFEEFFPEKDLGQTVKCIGFRFVPVMKGKCISVPILHVITPHTDAGILPGSRSGAGSAGGSAGSFHPRVFEKTSLSIFAMQYPMQGPCFA